MFNYTLFAELKIFEIFTCGATFDQFLNGDTFFRDFVIAFSPMTQKKKWGKLACKFGDVFEAGKERTDVLAATNSLLLSSLMTRV